MPFGASNIDVTGYLINLPGNAYTTGQAVVYHAGGGSAGSLVDGDTYYVIVDPGNPNQISLASTYANATAQTPVPVLVSPVTGTGNTLSEIFQTFGAASVDPTGYSIHLPDNVFTTGQAVIYHANGGSVNGLTDGDTYYVVVDPNNTGSSAYIGLASSSANATAATPVLIQLTGVTGTGNYLSEVDVETQCCRLEPEPVAGLDGLEHRRAGAVPIHGPVDPRSQFRGEERCDRGIGQHRHGFGPGCDHVAGDCGLPQNEALDLAAAQPADITFFNAGPGNTLVETSPTDPDFNPVELTVTLEKGISLENSRRGDATAAGNLLDRSRSGRGEQGPILPITIDHLIAHGAAVGHPRAWLACSVWTDC